MADTTCYDPFNDDWTSQTNIVRASVEYCQQTYCSICWFSSSTTG